MSGRVSQHTIRQNIVSDFQRLFVLAFENSKSFLKNMDMMNKGFIEPVYMVEEKIKMGGVCEGQSEQIA